MPSNHLPPNLAKSLVSLQEAARSPQHQVILNELESVSDVIEAAIAAGVSGSAIDRFELLRSGITTVGGNVCKCCQRPF